MKVNIEDRLVCDSQIKTLTIHDCMVDIKGQHVNDEFEEACKLDCSTVSQLIFSNCYFESIPISLSKYFPNLKFLEASSCGLSKITKADFKGLPNLKGVQLRDNKLTTLPNNLFVYTPDIEYVAISCNQIKTIGPNIFDSLKSLGFVNFMGNQTIDEAYANSKFKTSGLSTKGSLISLERLKQIIRSDCKPQQDLPNSELVLPRKVSVLDALKDITIVVENEKILAHRFMLAAFSPVLAQMFIEDPDMDVLDLAEVSSENFEFLLDYIYNGNFPNETCDLVGIYAASAKLQIEPMRKFAEKTLEIQANATNAYMILVVSNKYESQQLKSTAFEVIRDLMPEKTLQDDWKNQPKKIGKIIEAKEKMLEIIRKAQQDFEELSFSDDESCYEK